MKVISTPYTNDMHVICMHIHFFEGLIAPDEKRLDIFKSAVVIHDPHKTDLARG